jgi:hypothetical protein
MRKGTSNQQLKKMKGFTVTIYPKTDYAFIASLIFILYQTKQEFKRNAVGVAKVLGKRLLSLHTCGWC